MRAILAFVVLSVTLAGCTGLGTPREPTAAVVEPTLEACFAATEPAALFACAQPYLEAAAREPRALLVKLADARANGTIDDCHMLAHHLGHEAFDAHGDVVETLRAGSAACFKGYYHGVVEAGIAARARAGNTDVARLCDAARDDADLWDGCVHGVGHGLMWRSEGDVLGSLRLCEALGEDARGRCQAGVLMENSLQLLAKPESEYARLAPAACDGLALPEQHREACAEQIGEVAMFRYRHDETRANAVCAAIPDEAMRAPCQRGVANEAEAARM